MTADVGPIQHEPSMCTPELCPGTHGCWCAACESEVHGDKAIAWMAERAERTARHMEAVERIRSHHDVTLGHSWTNRVGYCAEPDGISATYCETGILLAAIR